MIRVLHLSSEKSWRGGEQQIAYLIDEIEGDQVKNYVACRISSPFESYCKTREIPHISLDFSSSFNIKTALKIKSFCKRNQIDIVHMHSSKSHTLGLLSVILGNKSRLILSRRVDFPIRKGLVSKWKYNQNKIKGIICVSNEIREILMPHIRNKKKLHVIHSGIDLKKFNPSKKLGKLHAEFNLEPDEKIVANVSAIAPHKDYYTFIDTANLFLSGDNKGVSFFIIGDGPEQERIKAYAKSSNYWNKIYFTGFRDDIPDIMPEIDVLLITSETEGLGTTIIDAMANKVPVVATAAGGIPELVIHNKTGLLYPVKDSEKLKAGLELILDNNELRNEVSENALNHIEKNFTKEIMARKTREIYFKLFEPR